MGAAHQALQRLAKKPPPAMLKTIYAWDRLFADMKSLLVIHNVGYQGRFSKDAITKAGLLIRDSITRGDGGQNLIGKEQSELLGFTRTQELLAAM